MILIFLLEVELPSLLVKVLSFQMACINPKSEHFAHQVPLDKTCHPTSLTIILFSPKTPDLIRHLTPWETSSLPLFHHHLWLQELSSYMPLESQPQGNLISYQNYGVQILMLERKPSYWISKRTIKISLQSLTHLAI